MEWLKKSGAREGKRKLRMELLVMLFTRWEESNQDEKDGIIHVLKELGKCHMRKQGGPDLGES